MHCRAPLSQHTDTECRSAGPAAAEGCGSGSPKEQACAWFCNCRQGRKQPPAGGREGPVCAGPDLHHHCGD